MTGEKDMRQDDAWLQVRRFEAPSPDLAKRIAAAAVTRPQRRPFSLWSWLFGTNASPIPHLRPAYAFAMLLILGLFLGSEIPNAGTGPTTTSNNATIQAFLYEEEYTL